MQAPLPESSSVTPQCWLETSHSGNIYAMEIGKCHKTVLPPHCPPPPRPCVPAQCWYWLDISYHSPFSTVSALEDPGAKQSSK